MREFAWETAGDHIKATAARLIRKLLGDRPVKRTRWLKVLLNVGEGER